MSFSADLRSHIEQNERGARLMREALTRYTTATDDVAKLRRYNNALREDLRQVFLLSFH